MIIEDIRQKAVKGIEVEMVCKCFHGALSGVRIQILVPVTLVV